MSHVIRPRTEDLRPQPHDAEGAVLTTTSQCELGSLAYLSVYPFGPRFLLFTGLKGTSSLESDLDESDKHADIAPWWGCRV